MNDVTPHMKKLLFIILLWPAILTGQVPLNESNLKYVHQVHEEVIGFTDRNLYLSGDNLWFSAFILINGTTESDQLSDVLYVDLIDADEKVVTSAKYEIHGAKCKGKFGIPAETSSGVYFLRFYTRYQRNFHQAQNDHVAITIVNTGLTLPASKGNSMFDQEVTKEEKIAVQISKPGFEPREEAKIEIKTPQDFKGWLCVSVARKGTLVISEKTVAGTREVQLAEDSVFYIPDIRGVSLSGFVLDAANQGSVAGIPVYLSAFGTNRLLRITKTETNGSFLFALNNQYGLSDVFVTIDPENTSGKKLMINTGFSNRFAQLPDFGFNIDSTYNQLLSAMLVDLETRNAFRKEEIGLRPVIENLPETYDLTVKLEDYIELSSLEEVFYEIVPPVFVKTDNGRKYLTVANYTTRQVSSAGLVLLDNVPVFNVNELLKISPVNIDRIDVINRPYYLGDYLIESVVSIKTRTGDFGGYKFPEHSVFLEYQTFEDDVYFSSPEYADQKLKNNPAPDFRTTLYWKPAYKMETQDAGFSFYTSDATGEYQILVRAISTDGSVIYGSEQFRVR